MARPKGTQAELEAKRRLAIRLFDEGMDTEGIANAMEVNERTVRRWLEAHRDDQENGLKAKPRVPRPCRLSGSQLLGLHMLLRAGAVANGYSNELWTVKRIRELVYKTFGGIVYSEAGMRELLHVKLGFSCQMPCDKNVASKPAAIDAWRTTTWAGIKKKPAGNTDTWSLSMNQA